MRTRSNPAVKRTDDRRRGWAFWLLLALLLLLTGAILWGIVDRAWAIQLESRYRGALHSQLLADYSADPRELRFAPLEPEIVEEVVRERRTPEPPSPTPTATPIALTESPTMPLATRPVEAESPPPSSSPTTPPTEAPRPSEPTSPPTPTPQATAIPSPARSPTAGSPTPSATPSPTPSPSAGPTPSATPTRPKTRSPSPQRTRTPLTPSPSPTPSSTPTATPTRPATPTPVPTAAPSPTPTATPTRPATPTPTPILAANKSTSNAVIHPGDTTTFHIDVTNQGENPANNVVVADTFPAPLEILSVDPPPSQHSGQTVIWRFPQLAPGTSVHMTVRAVLPGNVIPPGASERLVNVAQVSADGIPSFTTPPAYVYVHYPPRLSDVHSSIVPSSVIPGETVSFRITVRNDGGAGVDLFAGSSSLTFGQSPLPACRAHLASDTYVPGRGQAQLIFDSCQVPESFVPGETYPVRLHLVGEDDNHEPYNASWDADPSNYPRVVPSLSLPHPPHRPGLLPVFPPYSTSSNHLVPEQVPANTPLTFL